MAKTTRRTTQRAPAEEQPDAEMAGASAGGGQGGRQQGRRKAKAQASGKINGSIWEGGRGYNPGDELEFEKLNLSQEKLQFLANQTVMTKDGAKYLIEGFGVEPDENAEDLPKVTGVGSAGRRAGADEDVEAEADEEEEE